MTCRPIKDGQFIIDLPTISMMKLEMHPVALLPNSATLEEAKAEVFKKVWEALPSSFRRHGSSDAVVLKCKQREICPCNQEICSDEQLRQHLLIVQRFEATFKKNNKCERNPMIND